ncbi:MAG: FtsQ-type POTRA domain-containing protein [Chloroflexi bacterium]|nr:FtsQ-type POTRA domain-containing protein [Chloroflexota bacterium]
MQTRRNRSASTTNQRRSPRRVRLHTTATAAALAPAIAPASDAQLRSKLLAGGALGVLIASLLLLFNTDWFYVDEIEIVGARYLTSSEIQRASGVNGYNIFFIDSASIERTLMRLPEIKTVRVQTGLLNRVKVEIQERQPVLTWARGSENYWVDADGITIVARAALMDVPTLRDVDAAPVKVGQRAPAKPFEAFRQLRDTWGESAKVYEWSNGRGIALMTEQGWKIYFGDANEMLGKVAVARALIAQLKGKSIKFIDVGQGEPFYQ